MKNLLFFILIGVVCSCKNTQNQEIKKEEAKKLSKLLLFIASRFNEITVL